jgi:hypothetical protein
MESCQPIKILSYKKKISSPYVLLESQKRKYLIQGIRNIFHTMEFLQRWDGNVISTSYRQGLYKIHDSSTHILFLKYQYITIKSLEVVKLVVQEEEWLSTKQTAY